jgi:hypothetical protein
MGSVFPLLAGLTLRGNLIDGTSLATEKHARGLPRAIGQYGAEISLPARLAEKHTDYAICISMTLLLHESLCLLGGFSRTTCQHHCCSVLYVGKQHRSNYCLWLFSNLVSMAHGPPGLET